MKCTKVIIYTDYLTQANTVLDTLYDKIILTNCTYLYFKHMYITLHTSITGLKLRYKTRPIGSRP